MKTNELIDIEYRLKLEHRRLKSDFVERLGTALTDGLFISSRDGRTFNRWGKAFLRPGPLVTGNWTYSDNYQSCGLIEPPSPFGDAPADELLLNFATSAAGSIRVEVQDEAGEPIEGFREDQCWEVIGDSITRSVSWVDGRSIASLSGRTVRLRFVIKDADLYSFRFSGGVS